MKAKMLKIAGVKTETAFYKKYPTQEAFMKVHGKAFKKAQMGAYIGGDTNPNASMINFNDVRSDVDKLITGMNDAEREEAAYKQATMTSNNSGNSGGFDIGALTQMLSSSGGEGMEGIDLGGMAGGARNGRKMRTAQNGITEDKNKNRIPDYLEVNQPMDNNQFVKGDNSVGSFYQNTQPKYANYSGSMFKPNQIPQNNYVNLGKPPVDMGEPEAPMFQNMQLPFSQNNDYMNDATESTIPAEQPLFKNSGEKSGSSKAMDTVGKYLGPVGGVIKGIQALKEEGKMLKSANQMKELSDLQLQASRFRPEQKERRYVRPEDVVNTGEAFFPIYGVGTNPLAKNGARLEDGGMVGGNPTEIQNTYGNGNSIYDNLEYEPLYNINQQKSFYYGGEIDKAQDGFSNFASSGGTDMLRNTISAIGGENAGGDIGGTIGSSIGSAVGGPVGGFIGQGVGQIAGMLLDRNPANIKKAKDATYANIDNIAINQMAPSIQAGYASHVRNGGEIPNYEDGGYMNPNYNPQVITMFGDHDSEDFADYANKYRAGGNIRGDYKQPNERAFNQSAKNGTALDGSLEPMWGGTIKDVSYNPHIGNMAMGFGNDHDESDGRGNTGIGMKVLDDGGEVTGEVEIETKEPMINIGDSITVLGARIIPEQLKLNLNIKKGTTFKKVGEEIGKKDNKINKQKEKLVKEYSNINPLTPYDKLKATATELMIKGLDDQQKINANILMGLSSYQNDSEELSKYLGYEDVNKFDKDLEKGKFNQNSNVKKAKYGTFIPKAKYGTSIPKAQTGDKVVKGRGDKWSYTKAGDTGNPVWDDIKRYEQEWTPSVKTALADKERAKKMLEYINGSYGNESEKVKKSLNKFSTDEEKINFLSTQGTNKEVGPIHHVIDAAIKYTAPGMTTALKEQVKKEKKENPETKPVDYKRSELIDFGNQILPYLRPTDQEQLNPNQLMGEMYAMSNNQLDPVQAQLYRPELAVPYDISYQDQLNENQADYNLAQRMMGYNPAAQANLNAQKYQANSKVLAEQFRANQAMKAGVYDQNRNTLNQAKLTNLGILDKQYERQAGAMSNTKATTQAALNSISDKYAKNALENKTLGIYENMYNYRYDSKGRAINMNPLFQPTIGTVGSANATQRQVPVYKEDGKTIDHYQLETYNPNQEDVVADDDEEITPIVSKKNGGKINKQYAQSSIVRAFKQ